MNCPVCKNEPMLVLELAAVEIDYCAACKGIWLDAGELEMLLDDEQDKNTVLASFKADTGTHEKPVKCPVCNKRMQKVLCEDDQQVCIDRCRNNDGLWFDEGELEQVLALKSMNQSNKILNLLKDMFGKQ